MIQGNFNSDIAEKHFRERRKITLPTQTRSRKANLDKMRQVLQNWWTPEEITNLKHNTVNTYRWYINQYLKGNLDKVPDRYLLIIREYDKLLRNEPVNFQKITKIVKPEIKVKETVKEVKPEDNLNQFVNYLKSQGIKEITLKF